MEAPTPTVLCPCHVFCCSAARPASSGGRNQRSLPRARAPVLGGPAGKAYTPAQRRKHRGRLVRWRSKDIVHAILLGTALNAPCDFGSLLEFIHPYARTSPSSSCRAPCPPHEEGRTARHSCASSATARYAQTNDPSVVGSLFVLIVALAHRYLCSAAVSMVLPLVLPLLLLR